KSWWLFENQIVGFDDYRKEQNARVGAKAGAFDYDATVAGFKVLNDSEFEVTLTRPVQQFIYKLTMFQLAILPREAVEKYGKEFAKHPVGTGPFVLDLWEAGKS